MDASIHLTTYLHEMSLKGFLGSELSQMHRELEIEEWVPTEIDQVVETLKYFIPTLRIQEISEEESLVERSVADLLKLIEAVNWHPSIGLKDGTAQIVAYEQNRCARH